MARRGPIPGLKRQRKAHGRFLLHWVASQLARDAKGFAPKTKLLWNADAEPSAEEWAVIRQECSILTGTFREWQATGRLSKLRSAMIVGTIYFIQRGNMVKIGFAANVKKRIRQLQTASPEPIALIAVLEAAPAVEKHLHHRFRKLRVRGEWFRLEKPILDFIADECASRCSDAA